VCTRLAIFRDLLDGHLRKETFTIPREAAIMEENLPGGLGGPRLLPSG